MQTLEFYEVRTTDGHHDSTVACFSDEIDADLVASDDPYRSVRPGRLIIYDSAYEYQPELDHAARESGLAKLSEVEKRALGLDSP